MMLKISDWMMALREHLHIAPIEASVIAIEAKVIAIEDVVENVNVNIATGQALLANEQKRLEVILTEIKNTACQLITVIEGERCAKKETEIQIAAAIAAMTNEMKKAAESDRYTKKETEIQIAAAIEAMTNEMKKVAESDRCTKKETEIQIAAAIAAMTNEMKRVADIVDQHIRSTRYDRHNDHHNNERSI